MPSHTQSSLRPLLAKRVAIVTGAARGIGFATAQALSEEGATVLMSDVDEDALNEAAAALPDAYAVAGDLTDPHFPTLLLDRCGAEHGRLDIVVNNAGYNWDAPLHELEDEQITAMLEIHVTAVMRLLRAAHPLLARQADHQRKVINVSSISATMGMPGQVNYDAAKAAVLGLTRGLAKEWGPLGVNVNAIAPGFIDTRLTSLDSGVERLHIGERVLPVGIPEARRLDMVSSIPLGRAGTTREVADVVRFLASSWSDYVHGQVLHVTGGISLGMN